MNKAQNVKYYLIAAVALITFLVYLPALQNDFVSWDDGPYVYQNPHIRSFDATFLTWAFFDFYASNWHPLTWISHSLDYVIWGLDPRGHHLTNLILHTVNTALVVFLVIKLLEALQIRTPRGEFEPSVRERVRLVAGGTTGLLFGLHPVHVESVAWVAERKDLLCALFFLLSIVMYMRYANSRESVVGSRMSAVTGRQSKGKQEEDRKSIFINKHYLLALGFFVLALLSKPMAVSLPIILLILDWHPFNRIRSWETLRSACGEKLPFFALSLISTILTILAQRAGAAMQSLEFAPLTTRVLVAFHALIAYFGKMIWPLDLIPFYPYPKEVSLVSLDYLLPIVLVIGTTAICIVKAEKQKLLSAAWAYYVVMLLPVLGLVQVGHQSMADRYTYLPSLGPFLIMGSGAAWCVENVNTLKKYRLAVAVFSAVIALLLIVSLSYVTVRQIALWKNSMVLWSFVIEKQPHRIPLAYYNRGNIYARSGLFDQAVADYSEVIALDPSDDGAYYYRGKAYAGLGQLPNAIADLNKAIALNQHDAEMLVDRGLIFSNAGQSALAIADFERACSLGNKVGCQALQYRAKFGYK